MLYTLLGHCINGADDNTDNNHNHYHHYKGESDDDDDDDVDNGDDDDHLLTRPTVGSGDSSWAAAENANLANLEK